jgi:hypothetical protein
MLRIACLLFVLAAACAGERGDYPGPPELTLGSGEYELVPIHSGDPVPIAWGRQGGSVVWGAATVRYLDPEQLELTFSITPPQGAASLRRVVADLDDADDGFALTTSLGHPVFLPDEDRFTGVPCVWRLEARDRHGRSAVDEKTIVPTKYDYP